MQKHFCILSIALLLFTETHANNIQIGPVSIDGDTLKFTISWDNSWRTTNNPNNWDAVWVFVKRSDCAAIQWHHANLSASDADHSADSPLFVDAYADKKGVMIYRSATGFGNIGSTNVKLKLDAPSPGNYQYKVFGIEMVYVPQGAFYVGDGVASGKFQEGLSNNFFLVGSESALPISPTPGNLWSAYITSGPFTLPAAYPKGYSSFYCMKYELSQGQYADFLNILPSDAAQNRYPPNHYNNSRFTIHGPWPIVVADVPDRALGWISIDDYLAYLDWSALSPLTEMEYEKACRGNSINIPVANEYAWGSNAIANAHSFIPGTENTPAEAVDDIIPPGAGIANYFAANSILGPLRCGFAAKASTTRFQASATYYGLTEMSGNQYELCYNVDTSIFGRSYLFTGTHGDGELAVSPNAGYANQGWPGESPLDFTTQYFSFAARGGAWASGTVPTQLRISNREANIINTSVPGPDIDGRSPSFGGRGVSRRQ